MNEPEFKFNKRWKDFLEQYRESARRIDWEQIQFRLHIFWVSKMKKIVFIIDAWIGQGQGEHGHFFLNFVFIKFFSWD